MIRTSSGFDRPTRPFLVLSSPPSQRWTTTGTDTGDGVSWGLTSCTRFGSVDKGPKNSGTPTPVTPPLSGRSDSHP